VVLHEGVVTTPRHPDQGARCSAPSACPRSGWPARLGELSGFRVCIVGMTAPGNGSGDNQIIRLLHVCSFETAGANLYQLYVALHFARMRNPRRCGWVTQVAVDSNRIAGAGTDPERQLRIRMVERLPTSTAASGSSLDYAAVNATFGPKRTDEAGVTISPYYLALAGTICVGVGAQTLFKIGATGAESTMVQLLRASTIVGLLLYLVSAILYVIALRQMSISTAFPTVSLGYVLIAAIDYFFFKEPVGLLQLGGLILIMAGVALLHH